MGPIGFPWVPFGALAPPEFPGVPVGPRDRHLVGAREGRHERSVAERIPPERVNWVGGMRVSVFGLYFGLEMRPAGGFWADQIRRPIGVY